MSHTAVVESDIALKRSSLQMNTCSNPLLYLLLLCPLVAFSAGTGTYLEHLNPVVYLELDQTPTASVTLSDGSVLTKSSSFAGDFPSLVAGPNAWVSNGWDFSQCDGAYLLDVDAKMSTVGNIAQTDGMTISFWTKGSYSGITPRIMNGAFDIISTKTGVNGGTNDYKNAATGGSFNTWDNVWHHIAISVDYSSQQETIRIYQDGVLAGSRDYVYLNSMNTGIGGDWFFGARNGSDSGFNFGALAGIAVFDRNLSEYEVNAITAGPVFAGLDQVVSITDDFSVDGVIPSGSTAAWTMQSGPDAVIFGDASNVDTSVTFSATGDYVLMLSAGGYSSTVHLSVVPNAAPTVITGNGVTLPTSQMSLSLTGVVEDLSIPNGGALTSVWSVVSAPVGAVVSFTDATDPTTHASFNMAGLYRLQLTATDGELITTSEFSVLIEDGVVQSYVRLLRPTVLLDFDRPAASLNIAQLDLTGSTGYQVRFPENGVPQLEAGARSYTGYGWDFSQTDSDVELINGEHLRNIQLKEHPARSLSYWFKANGSAANGYLSTVFGLESYSNGSIKSHTYAGQFTDLVDSPTEGVWHHVVVVLESSNYQFVRKLYVDGVLVDQATDAYPDLWWEWGSAEIRYPIYVGSRGRSGLTDSFTGQLDDYALFDYALSASDVSYLYNGPTAAELALLAAQDALSVDAGVDQYIELPASYEASLAGSAVSAAGLTPSWRFIEGDGTVSFSDPNRLNPTATFTSIEDDEDGAYSRFILELSLVTDTGKILISDQVTVLFYPRRSPAHRSLTATPAVGEHPRILFTNADLPELRAKATTVPMVMKALAAMKVDVDNLDNPSNTYGAFYEQLKNGSPVSVETVYGDNEGGIFKVLAEAAYIALLGNGGVSDTAKLTELATAFTTAVRDVATWYEPNYLNPLVHDVNWAVGLSYDLLYNWMDESGRADARALLSLMTSHRSSIGGDLSGRLNSTNWAGLHDHILTAAIAIEGEAGYDPGVLDSMNRSNVDFMSQYGIFESGFPHEGYAYYTLGMSWHSVSDYISTRRAGREDSYATTRFYKSIEAAFRLMDPSGAVIRSHHDVVEDSTGAGALIGMPRHILIAKHMWPDDPMVDYVYRELLGPFLLTQDRYFDIFHAIFGESVAFPNQTVSEAAGTLEPNVFCPDRGLATSRNRWGEDGLRFEFRCRTDKYWIGHQHSDVNSFELWSHGKPWIVDRGKFASTNSDVASTILIDDTGACSADDPRWPSLPGQFIEYSETDTETIAVGDARLFYTYSKGAPVNNSSAPKVYDHGLLWSDFYTPRAGFTMPDWMAVTPYDLNGYGTLDGVYDMLPVEFAYRTTLLTKGTHPYVLVVDDIQRDHSVHDYTWIANTVINGLVEVESQTTDRLVLRYVGEGNSGARLLVQVLEATGQSGDIYLDTDPIAFGVESIEASRIKVECSQVLKPNYKILLYPYEVGDPLPTVQWNSNGNTVSIAIGSDVQQFYFDTSVDDRTRISSETPAVEVLTPSIALQAVSEYAPTTQTEGVLQFTSNLGIPQNWTANSDQSWLTLSSSGGVLGANETLDLTATLTNAVYGFEPGIYTAQVTFSSDQDIFDRVVTIEVTVVEPYIISPTSRVIDIVIDQVETVNQVFTVTSQLPIGQSWTARSDQAWLTLSSTSGTISSLGALNLTASLDAAAFSLAEATYQAVITFHSDARATESQLTVTLNVSALPPHVPSELFSSGSSFDLDNQQLTFVPSGDAYRVYLDAISELPNSVSAATVLGVSSSDDASTTVTPAWQNAPVIGGSEVSSLRISSNGVIAMDIANNNWQESAASHFAQRQIAALWDDLNPGSSGTIYYEFIAGDRVIVSYIDVVEYGASQTNTFQVELFDDGSGMIRLSYLTIASNDSMVGVSNGAGAPVGWPADMIDFSALSPYPVPVVLPELSLLLVDGSTSESSMPIDGAILRIVSSVLLESDLSLNLSLDGSASAADTTGTLNAGAHRFLSGLQQLDLSAQAVDDGIAEGNETLQVSLLAGAGYTVGTPSAASISILDEPYDYWRYINDIITVAATDDTDGDGVPTLVEYALGSEPEGADRNYSVVADMVSKTVTITLENPVPSNVSLSAEWSIDLTNWNSENVSISDQVITITGYVGDQVFVRLVAMEL